MSLCVFRRFWQLFVLFACFAELRNQLWVVSEKKRESSIAETRKRFASRPSVEQLLFYNYNFFFIFHRLQLILCGDFLFSAPVHMPFGGPSPEVSAPSSTLQDRVTRAVGGIKGIARSATGGCCTIPYGRCWWACAWARAPDTRRTQSGP
jgi:hypothetical protein